MNGGHTANQGRPTRLANANDVGNAPDCPWDADPLGSLDGTGAGGKWSTLDEGGFRGDLRLGSQRSLANLEGTGRSRDSGSSRNLWSAGRRGDGAKGGQLHERGKQKNEN